jgi:hypothetical protein
MGGAMAIDIKHDQDRQMLNIIISETFDLDELTSTFEAITNSRDYPPNIRAVWDFRKADISSVNADIINRLVEIRSHFTKRSNCRSALIVSSDLQYGFSRMFEMLTDGKIPPQLKVFREYEEAVQWILDKGISVI